MTTTVYALKPLDAPEADRLRAAGGRTYIADSNPGYPCRACLRDAEVGEELLLVSHDPFVAHSPYRSASPIFIHSVQCDAPPVASSALPTQLTSRQLSVRAFDHEAMMIDAAVIEGIELDVTLRSMFADDAVDTVHVHNAVRGCWATNVVRAS